MSDVVKEIGKFASSTIGNILQIGTAITGTILLTTPLAPIGWTLITISMGLSFVGNYYEYQQYKKLQERLKKSSTGHLINTKQSNIPLPIIYGTCRVGGNIVFIHTDGNNNENLWMVMTLSEGKIEIGNEVIILNEDPVFKYSKKTNNQWILKVKSSSITNIRLKIKYHYKIYRFYDREDEWHWYYTENNYELAIGETKQTSDITIQYISNDNILITVNNPNKTRIDNVVIYEYSEDNGITWKKYGNYEGYMSYFIDRGDGTGVGDTTIKDYIIKKLGFKVPKNVVLLYIKLIWKEGKWQGIPNITVLLKGKNDIYDPRDGQYKFTNNPALILLDYLTSKRYGFGIDINRIDLDSFIEVANYCDENNFVFDGIITDGRGIDIIEHILNHFRGYLVYQNGKFKVKVKDLNIETPVAVITEDDIIEGTFQINMPDISEIPNVVKVNYINPELDYKVDNLLIEDINVSSIEERKEMEIELYGCNTLQAKKLGTYYLERARLNLTISFVTSPEFFNLELGDLFYLDYESYGIKDKIFRIIELTPTSEGYCKITAIIEDINLYNHKIDVDIYNIDLTNIPNPFEPYILDNIVLEEVLQKDKDGKLKNWLKIIFDNNIPFIEQFEIWIKPEDGNWYQYGIVKNSPVMIPDLVSPKTYYVKVVPVTIYGAKDFNANPTSSITLLGKLIPPPDVQSITASFLGDRIQLQWTPVEDLDLDGYEVRLGDSWETGNVIVTRHKSTTLTVNIIKEGTYRFWVKAIDTCGNYSKNPADCEVIVSGIVGRNVVEKYDVDLTTGNYTYTFGYIDVNTGINNLISYNNRTWEEMINIEGFNSWQDWITIYNSWYQPVPSKTSYETSIYTLPDILTGRIYTEYVYDVIGEGFNWENFNASTNTWQDINASYQTWLSLMNVGKFNITLYYSQDGINWYAFTNTAGDVKTKYIKAKIDFENNTNILTFRFKKFNIYFDMPDKQESGIIEITSGTQRVYFNEKFLKVKSIVLTSGTDGKYPILIDYTNQYFDVKMNDNGAGTIHYLVLGY